jgi:hypothetical protein
METLGSPRGKAYLRGLETALTGASMGAGRVEHPEDCKYAQHRKVNHYFGIMYFSEFCIR